MLLADVTLTDILWSMIWFFFLFMIIMIFFQIIGDLFRDHSTSGIAKAIWIICLIIAPPLTMLIYLVVRGGGMADRSREAQVKMQQDYASYIQQTAGAAGPAEQIAKAKELLDSGAITQAEYDSIKAKALAS
jgi:hypothetical protein